MLCGPRFERSRFKRGEGVDGQWHSGCCGHGSQRAAKRMRTGRPLGEPEGMHAQEFHTSETERVILTGCDSTAVAMVLLHGTETCRTWSAGFQLSAEAQKKPEGISKRTGKLLHVCAARLRPRMASLRPLIPMPAMAAVCRPAIAVGRMSRYTKTGYCQSASSVRVACQKSTVFPPSTDGVHHCC